MPYDQIPSDDVIQKTADALTANGFIVHIVANGAEAKAKALELVPPGSEIMTNSSTTNEQIGLNAEFNDPSKFKPVRVLLMDKDADPREKKRHGAAPEFSTGSVHAITLDGHVLIASASGSQLPGYAFGADHVVWIAGAHKIVKDTEEGMKRIRDYVLPLEDARAMKAYGRGSAINNLLIINAVSKQTPGRINLILVKEVLGF